MKDAILDEILDNDNKISVNDAVVVKTDEGAKDGQNKCPKCGATDISVNLNNGHLRCNFCRHEFEPEKISGLQEDISKLEGNVIASGASNIQADTNDVLTFKCSSCGAEVVIDTASSLQARCHWCRNTLSVNQQIPNGSIPDVVLPFKLKKEEAKQQITDFVNKRKFFANPKFKEEFTTENIMGVYFPYMVIDVNAHNNMSGEGEHQTRQYTINDNRYYDADLYRVEREFDVTINGLTVESSSDKLNTISNEKTNNIINAIMPFDIENCVKYDANYLKGFTSEKRDTNIEQLSGLVNIQAKDIAKFAANDSLKFYDRGVRWDHQEFNVKGQQWKAAYLPVWLYSYQEVKGNSKKLHYVAVNARTKEIMGSVPIHMPKLIITSIFVEICGIIANLFIDFDYDWLFLLTGIVFYIAMYLRYRNSNARHKYETETKTEVTNLRKVDNFVKNKKKLNNSMMDGANNKDITGKDVASALLDNISRQTELSKFVKK